MVSAGAVYIFFMKVICGPSTKTFLCFLGKTSSNLITERFCTCIVMECEEAQYTLEIMI